MVVEHRNCLFKVCFKLQRFCKHRQELFTLLSAEATRSQQSLRIATSEFLQPKAHTTYATNKQINCNAVSVMFVPLQSSTLRRRLGRNAVRLAGRQNLVSAATASAVTGAVHSAPAPLASTILIPPWQSCSLAQRRRSTCKNNFYHPHLTFV